MEYWILYVVMLIALLGTGVGIGYFMRPDNFRDYHAEREMVANYLEKFKNTLDEKDYGRFDGAVNMLYLIVMEENPELFNEIKEETKWSGTA